MRIGVASLRLARDKPSASMRLNLQRPSIPTPVSNMLRLCQESSLLVNMLSPGDNITIVVQPKHFSSDCFGVPVTPIVPSAS